MLESDAERKLEDGQGALEAADGNPSDAGWVELARQSWMQSETYMDAYVRKEWAKNLDHFNGKHPQGSKYNSQAYKHRSRLFRPKTRAAVLRREAACAAAFFSTSDVVSVTPEDDSDPIALASAGAMEAVLNRRLTRTIPWFLILMAQQQTAMVQSICVSRQSWRYEEEIEDVEVLVQDVFGAPVIGADGLPMTQVVQDVRVIKDEPEIVPIAPENFRCAPGADWLDPVKTSPYIIEMIPMFAQDVRERSERVDPKTGAAPWKPVSEQALRLSTSESVSSIRREREGHDRLEDHAMGTKPVADNEIVWVHANIVRRDGEDWFFYTLGTQALLTDPVPLDDVYPDGRPYVVGVTNVEAFKLLGQSKVQQLSDLQSEANNIANMRIDNVQLSMVGRYFAKRGAALDSAALARGVPGSVVMMNNPGEDVRWERPGDVTGASYAEQDRLNLDFDELAGTFSPGSVQANRALNETVGGMSILTGDANSVTEYELRIFAETYVEPVLRQLAALEARYETDETVLRLAASEARILERYGIDWQQVPILNADLSITVNVGLGSTNPQQRMGRVVGAFGALFQVIGPFMQMAGPAVFQSPGFQEIAKEIFGAAGFKDGKRFLDLLPQQGGPDQQGVPPEVVQQMQQQMQAMAQELQRYKDRQGERMQTEAMKTQSRQQELVLKARLDDERADRDMQRDIARERAQLAYDPRLAAIGIPMMPRLPAAAGAPRGV